VAAVLDPPADEPRADETPRAQVRLRDRAERPWIIALLASNVAVFALTWNSFVRPFWYDESWRAYHITLGSGWLHALKTANAPLAGGWLLIERAASGSLGNVEWALRLPVFVFLPVFSIATYRLLRWWLPRSWAGVTALLATLNGTLLVHGLLLKSYLPEAACTSLILCFWLSARERRAAGRTTWPMYLGIAVCGLVALPAIFLVVPIAAYDAWRWLRDRTRVRSLFPPAVMLGTVGLHTLLFVMPQSYLVHDTYWADFRLSGDAPTITRRLWTAVASFPGVVGTGGLTHPEGRSGSPFEHAPMRMPPYLPLEVIVAGGLIVFWIAGVAVARRRRYGDALLVTLGGALALQLVAATRGEWPMGFVRANEFLLPLLYALAAVGLHAVVSRARRGIVVVALVWVVALAGVTLWRDAQMHWYVETNITLQQIDQVVDMQRAVARPGDVVIVATRRRDAAQWVKSYLYYAQLNDRTRLPFRLATDDVLPLWDWTKRDAERFVRVHPKARRVFLLDFWNRDRTPEQARAIDASMRSVGYCERTHDFVPHGAQYTVFDRC
jgi:hypothetical protein